MFSFHPHSLSSRCWILFRKGLTTVTRALGEIEHGVEISVYGRRKVSSIQALYSMVPDRGSYMFANSEGTLIVLIAANARTCALGNASSNLFAAPNNVAPRVTMSSTKNELFRRRVCDASLNGDGLKVPRRCRSLRRIAPRSLRYRCLPDKTSNDFLSEPFLD